MSIRPQIEPFLHRQMDLFTEWLYRRVQPWRVVLIVVTILIILGAINFYTFTRMDPSSLEPDEILNLLIADFAVGLVFAAIIGWKLVQIWIARRSGSAGSKLHSRIVAMFGVLAVTPAIIVAVFSAVLFNQGIETWFSSRVTSAIDNSVEIAKAYFDANVQSVVLEIKILAAQLSALDDQRTAGNLTDEQFGFMAREALLSRAVEGNLAAIYVLSTKQEEPLDRIELQISEMPRPSPQDFEEAKKYNIYLLQNEDLSQIQALYRISEDRFFLFVRLFDPKVLEYRNATFQAVERFKQAEQNRFGIQMTFLLAYVVVALLLLLTAIWCGLWAANRLVLPIGRLVGAAERVSDGDLGVRVEVADNDDEISTLGRAFNRMTGQLQSQRNELVEANRQFDQRRRFTETVLSGVNAGVVGLDYQGRVNIANKSAYDLLETSPDVLIGQLFIEAVPEMAPLVRETLLNAGPGRGLVRGHVDLLRDDHSQALNVRVSSEVGEDDVRGLVVTFDDITDLVVAQRTAAWADVARRIAHEIKNPLTPIQLSAERLRRKYGDEITTDPEVFQKCTETIIRQVHDIGRMVDEFSSFARMPTAVMKANDFTQILRDAVFMQKVTNANIDYEMELPDETIDMVCDSLLVAQALTNVFKNAAEAISARAETESEATYKGQIKLVTTLTDTGVAVEISDNGCGLPSEDRHRLTEPYMTTRQKGTGLGLAIVRKILEDHQGELVLDDLPPSAGSQLASGGTIVAMIFPHQISETVNQAETIDDKALDEAADASTVLKVGE